MEEQHIITIPILPMGMINAFLVASSDGYILVDSGVPNSEGKIGKVLKRRGLTFRDIKLIVVTHAHGDHAGSARKLQELCQAPVLAHEADLPYYQGEKEMHYCPTGRFGQLLLKTGVPKQPYHWFTPDILLKGEEVLDLAQYGVNGTVFTTPGHTAGSISVTLSNKNVLAGDLVSAGILLGGIAWKNRAKLPPFNDSSVETAKELSKLLDAGIETFFLGHGGPVSSKEVKRYTSDILHA